MRATPRAAAPGAPIRFRRKGVGRVAAPSLLKTVVCNLSLSLEQRVDAEARSALGALLGNRGVAHRRSDRQGVALTLADVIWCAAGPDEKLQSRSKLIMVVAKLTGLSAGTCATWRRLGRGAPAAEAPPMKKRARAAAAAEEAAAADADTSWLPWHGREREAEASNEHEFEADLEMACPSNALAHPAPAAACPAAAPCPAGAKGEEEEEEVDRSPARVGWILGSLALRIYCDASLPTSAFTSWLSWLDFFFPGCAGNVNHSWNFAAGFGRTAAMQLNQYLSVQHWQRIPALHIPSDYARVFDGYTCLGEPLLILVHVITTPAGEIAWMLVSCSPNATNALVAGRGARGLPGAEGRGHVHAWKSSAAVAEHIRMCEQGVSCDDMDALLRTATNNADGAYIGPRGNGVVHAWARQVFTVARQLGHESSDAYFDAPAQFVSDSAWESPCWFHIAQLVGADADGLARLSGECDELLRALKLEFGFGSGMVLLRAAFKRSGAPPRRVAAPRKDNFKATAYASECFLKFSAMFTVLLQALRWRVSAEVLVAQEVAQKAHAERMLEWSRGGKSRRPQPPSQRVGWQTKGVRELRMVGARMLSPALLVFGLGRADLRRAFLIPFGLMAQGLQEGRLTRTAHRKCLLDAMAGAALSLCLLAGELRFLKLALGCGAAERARGLPGRLPFTRGRLRRHVEVFVFHRLLRFAPALAKALPDMLYPAAVTISPHYQGCALSDPFFVASPDEPARLPATATAEQREARAKAVAAARHARRMAHWDAHVDAVSDLARWLREERASLLRRSWGWESGGDSARPAALKTADAESVEEPDADYEALASAREAARAEDVRALLDRADEEADEEVEGDVVQAETLDEAYAALEEEADAGEEDDEGAPARAEGGGEEREAAGVHVRRTGGGGATEEGDAARLEGATSAWRRTASNWRRSWHGARVVGKAPARPGPVERFWESAAAAFEASVLVTPLRDGVSQEERDALLHVFHCLEPALFRFSAAARVAWEDPPREMFLSYDDDEIVRQYFRARARVIPQMMARPDAEGIWKPVAFLVEVPRRQLEVLATPDRVRAPAARPGTGGWQDVSVQRGSPGCVGKPVLVEMGGTWEHGVTRRVDRRADNKQLYKMLMTLEYAFVREAGVWACLRLLHRVVMAQVTSEQLAEMVCSDFTRAARAGTRHPSLGDIASGVRLRCAGVAGGTGDRRFVYSALDAYFRSKACHDPRQWHIMKTDRRSSAASMAIATHRARERPAAFAAASFAQCARRRLLGIGLGRELSFCNPRLGRELKKARNYKEAAAMRASSLKVFEPDLMAEDVEDFERDGASRAAALAHPAF